MVATTHVYEIFVHAPRERVWTALTDPDDTRRYFHGTRFDSSFQPGAPFVNLVVDSPGTADRPVVDGTVETYDPPHRFVLTWHVLYDAEMADEPPGRVEWTLLPANDDGSATRVTLRHGELALSPRTWAHVRLGWVEILSGLKTWLETGAQLPPVDTGQAMAAADVEGNWHRAQAVTANNSVWEMLDGRAEYGPSDTDEILGRAYAAAHHWARAERASAINLARASWLLSRVHATLGDGELALHHAERCRAHVETAGDLAADFDHAYVAEARARALACLGRTDEARELHRRAAAVPIDDEQDRAIFAADLAAGPWYGLPGA